MIFAYADPPYLGCAKKLYGDEHYDSEQSHRELIEKLVSDLTTLTFHPHPEAGSIMPRNTAL